MNAHMIDLGTVVLEGDLRVPPDPRGVVLFAHGSGSSRHSPRNRFVAGALEAGGMATLLFDLLTAEEERRDQATSQYRFDIGLLAERLAAATDWLQSQPEPARLPTGYFGASTGGAAALMAAARRRDRIAAVVSRGGRPDLAGDALAQVAAPTLLIVGGADDVVIDLNQKAIAKIAAPVKEMVIIPGASHLFEEPGKLEAVAELATEWFAEQFARSRPPETK